MKLHRKMLVIYLFLLAIVGGIFVVSLQISLNIYDQKLYEKSLQELDYFIQKVNERLEEVETFSYSVALDTDIQNQLASLSSFNYLSKDYSFQVYLLRDRFINELYEHSSIKNIIYTDGKQVTFKVGNDCGEIDEDTYTALMKACKEKRGGYVMMSPTEEYPYLLSGRDILEKKNASLDYLGSFIITTDVAGIISQHIDQLEAPNASLYVYADNNLIYQGDENSPDISKMTQDQGYEMIHMDGERYFLCYLKSSVTGWMYVNMFPYSQIYGNVMRVRYFLIGGMLLVFCITAFLLRRMSIIITKPLERLSESMQIVETGDFHGAKDFLKKEVSSDEVGMLTQEFQVMVDQIDGLIRENYEKQILLQDTKYRMLQAQINPHFLYNTLNALIWMVKAKRNDEAGKMIVELGQLLRASFAKDPYTTVLEEVETVKRYITIQQFRYQKRAEFIVTVNGNLEHYMIPRMILQPLVENSIYYGVDNSLTACQVSVTVQEEEDTILLEVEDTGQGMTPEEVSAVQNNTMEPKGHGIGLKNIRERLLITFETSTFQIESQLGVGTKISIRIPKSKVVRYPNEIKNV